MASRKWIAVDGTQFDKKADVLEYENRGPHIKFLVDTLHLDVGVANNAMDYFEKSFRVPKTRAKKVAPSVSVDAKKAA